MLKNELEQSKKDKVIHISIIILLIIIICGFVSMVMFKYQIEGETNAPFDISKVLMISTAEGITRENPTAKWDFNINQNNDVYITIEKNEKIKDAIKQVTINNIQIIQAPTVGSIQTYKPADKGLFKFDEKYKINDELKYNGSKSGSINNLEISNQGGTVLIRFCNENIGQYATNEQEQIIHDGTLIKNTNITLEQLNSKVQFDIIIETEKDVKYKTTLELSLPVGNIIDEGTSTKELNTDELILKRY